MPAVKRAQSRSRAARSPAEKAANLRWIRHQVPSCRGSRRKLWREEDLTQVRDTSGSRATSCGEIERGRRERVALGS